MITLYGTGYSRWARPYWTLQELELPFEPKIVNIRKGEHRSPEFLAVNPFGKLPAMTDGDLTLFESAAICTYLADKVPTSRLAPAAGTRERAIYDQWVSFAVTELEQPLWRIARNTFVYPEAERNPVDIERAKKDFHVTASTFESLVTENLVGDRFTVADIMVTYALRWASLIGLLGDAYPKLVAYMQHHMAGPAFPRSLYP